MNKTENVLPEEEFKEPFEIDFDLDFDIDDFDLIEVETPTRIIKPKISAGAVHDMVTFRKAVDLAAQIDLSKGARTTCVVSGNFIFGDVIEALVHERRVSVKKLYISTLSISEENIDSLKNVILMAQPEKVGIVLSGYFYSHEKFALVPYLYQELDDGTERFQCAFTNTHMKLCLIETKKGNHYVLSGSANLRSSNCIEQFDVEENEQLYRFYESVLTEQLEKFGTIDYKVMKKAGKTEVWQAVQQAVARVEAQSKEIPEQRKEGNGNHIAAQKTGDSEESDE